jgi:hypothetical protein
MTMFQLSNYKATLANVNLRTEKHGPEERGAADLKFNLDMMAERLDDFEKGLHSALLKEDPEADIADKADGRLTMPRFEMIGPIKLKAALVNQQVTIGHGLNAQAIILSECRVNQINDVEVKPGGSISLSLRVQCYPTEKQVGLLFSKLHSEVDISIESELPTPS